jgi:hypothetical protein
LAELEPGLVPDEDFPIAGNGVEVPLPESESREIVHFRIAEFYVPMSAPLHQRERGERVDTQREQVEDAKAEVHGVVLEKPADDRAEEI